jgi:hypothetical protein
VRTWQAGGAGFGDADEFFSSADDLGFGVSQRPVGDGASIDSVDGLTAWAVAWCQDEGLPGCAAFADRVVAMCSASRDDACRAAILVPSADVNPDDEGTYAFVPDASGANVIILTAGRGEGWPGAARYGGTSGLLTSILATMGVTPG